MRVPTTTFQNAFGKYLKLAVKGDEVIVTKNGRGVAKLIQYDDSLVYVMKEETADYYIRKRVSYEEFLEITEASESRYELIDGQIYLMAAPKHKHQIAVGEIFGKMYNWFQDKPCSPLTSPFDVKLYNDAEKFEDDPNVVQPDILVICDEENIDEKDTYQGIPSLVVEVLSKSTKSLDMILKLNLYMKSGVDEYWIVDTQQKQVLVYTFEDRAIDKFKSYEANMIIESSYFEGLRVPVERVFGG